MEGLSLDTEIEQRIHGVFTLCISFTATYIEHGQQFGYLRTDLDATTTARGIIGAIIGGAIIGLDTTIDADARARALDTAISVMFDGITSR